jgi:hypothetical protein
MQIRTIAQIAVLLLASAGLGACHEEGPAERAGKAVDEAVEGAQDTMEDARDNVEDAADEAGKKAKEMKEQALGE